MHVHAEVSATDCTQVNRICSPAQKCKTGLQFSLLLMFPFPTFLERKKCLWASAERDAGNNTSFPGPARLPAPSPFSFRKAAPPPTRPLPSHSLREQGRGKEAWAGGPCLEGARRPSPSPLPLRPPAVARSLTSWWRGRGSATAAASSPGSPATDARRTERGASGRAERRTGVLQAQQLRRQREETATRHRGREQGEEPLRSTHHPPAGAPGCRFSSRSGRLSPPRSGGAQRERGGGGRLLLLLPARMGWRLSPPLLRPVSLLQPGGPIPPVRAEPVVAHSLRPWPASCCFPAIRARCWGEKRAGFVPHGQASVVLLEGAILTWS